MITGDEKQKKAAPAAVVAPKPPPPRPAAQARKGPISLFTMLATSLSSTFLPPPADEGAAAAARAEDSAAPRGGRRESSPRRGLSYLAASTGSDGEDVGLHLSSSSLASSVLEGSVNPLNPLFHRSVDEAHFVGADAAARYDESASDAEGEPGASEHRASTPPPCGDVAGASTDAAPLLSDEQLAKLRHTTFSC